MAEPNADEVATWPDKAQAMYWKSIAERGMMAAPFVPAVVSQPTVVLPRVSSPAENTSNVKGVVQAVGIDDVESKGSSASNKRKASKRLKDDWGTDIGKRIQSTASMLSDQALGELQRRWGYAGWGAWGWSGKRAYETNSHARKVIDEAAKQLQKQFNDLGVYTWESPIYECIANRFGAYRTALKKKSPLKWSNKASDTQSQRGVRAKELRKACTEEEEQRYLVMRQDNDKLPELRRPKEGISVVFRVHCKGIAGRLHWHCSNSSIFLHIFHTHFSNISVLFYRVLARNEVQFKW